ncbi:MAG: hypothetical protein IPI49_28425 [Myxococcales bacterium]|nr:hypothetical protein [Myxococcales bacterium]
MGKVRSLLGAVALGAIAAALLGGCSRASDELDSKRSPAMPPPHDVQVSEALRIEVVIDGSPESALTATTVRDIKPDFADSDRRGWWISTLIPKALGAKVLVAEGPSGVGLRLETPGPGGLMPALLLTRRGDVIVAAVDPQDPFPRYHGQGGRLRRFGDPMPRLSPVSKLSIQR